MPVYLREKVFIEWCDQPFALVLFLQTIQPRQTSCFASASCISLADTMLRPKHSVWIG